MQKCLKEWDIFISQHISKLHFRSMQETFDTRAGPLRNKMKILDVCISLAYKLSYHSYACSKNVFLIEEGKSHHTFIHLSYLLLLYILMLNTICLTTNQLEHIPTNLCMHLSCLEDQRNL